MNIESESLNSICFLIYQYILTVIFFIEVIVNELFIDQFSNVNISEDINNTILNMNDEFIDPLNIDNMINDESVNNDGDHAQSNKHSNVSSMNLQDILNPNSNTFCPSKNINKLNAFKNNQNFSNLIFTNLQGMLEGCHFEEFTNEINKSKNIDFIAICETWLRNKIHTNEIVEINGFKIHRSDRKTNGKDKNKGGGVALYVRNNIKTKCISSW